MRKILASVLGLALLGGIGSGAVYKASASEEVKYTQSQENKEIVRANDCLQIRAKASYLMDFSSKTPMYRQNETNRLPIASMCKIMTALLCFEAVDRGELSMDEQICVSERAASMGGSQVFLEANAKYPVSELIKSIVVCSANDSCVAMAERIAGSEELFVEKMNERAKQLGANDTLFANCTGLPKSPQYSCAKDVAYMLCELLNHAEYFNFAKVWLEKFTHPEGRYTEITNTNKLVRFYDGCDGGKTGFTNEAGFCLAATAKRGEMRIISVVIGEESSKNRFDDVRTMLDYAFANYTQTPIFQAGEPLERSMAVDGGKRESIAVYPARSVYALTKRGEKSKLTYETVWKELKAPIEKGAKVGELLLFKEGVEIDRIPLLACEGVEKAGFGDRLREIAQNWNG